MKCNVGTLYELLSHLAQATDQSLERYGYGIMSEKIGDDNVSFKYLYDLHLRVMHALTKKSVKTINLQPAKLDIVARFLRYESYRAFAKKIETPRDKVLTGTLGNYYCYVRRNSPATAIFCSPVRIFEQHGKVWFELKGPTWNYQGEVELRHGCLFVLMKAAEGKAFHHVYKIGQREKPAVLQGIFSGVSTTFDPIGGRVVLIRSDEEFQVMKACQLSPAQLKKSTSLKALEGYFRKFDDNNLSIKKVVAFTTTDL